jgi:hypothetical protein
MAATMKIWIAMVVLAAAGPAWGDNVLRGPYPFLRDNELAVHGGYGAGFGDSFAGPKATVDYGYKLDGGWWLDVGGSFLSGVCRTPPGGAHCARQGDAAEVVAGVKWKLRMSVPVVPYVKAVVGLAYLFPDGARSGLGPLVRAGVGGHYFFYEWLGVGAELTLALGHAGYQDAVGLSRTVAGLDAIVGAVLAF